MQKNKYRKSSKISEKKFRALLKCYTLDETAKNTSYLVCIHVNTTERIFKLLRKKVATLSLLETKNNLKGDFEVDESYFGARRIRGKRGRGVAGKTPVFGILKRDGRVYVNIVKNCTRKQLMPIIEGKILEGFTIYSDGWKAYDGLILNGYDHYRSLS
jgi:transposase-like protein